MTETNELAIFDSLLAEVTLAVRPILEIKVTDPITERAAQSAGGQVAGLLKELERRRKEALAPLKLRVDQINAAAKRVEAVLAAPDQHIRGTLNAYAGELARKRQEELRIQAEREDAARKIAAEERRKQEAALIAKQNAERLAREDAANAERARQEAQAKAQRDAQEQAAKERSAAAALFGQDGAKAKRQAEEEAARLRYESESKARIEMAQQVAERRAMEERMERERLENEARIQREESERLALEIARRMDIEAQRVKGGRTEIVVEVLDAWAVPRELVNAPEVRVNDVKKVFKATGRQIPGLKCMEQMKVALRSEGLPTREAIS